MSWFSQFEFTIYNLVRHIASHKAGALNEYTPLGRKINIYTRLLLLQYYYARTHRHPSTTQTAEFIQNVNGIDYIILQALKKRECIAIARPPFAAVRVKIESKLNGSTLFRAFFSYDTFSYARIVRYIKIHYRWCTRNMNLCLFLGNLSSFFFLPDFTHFTASATEQNVGSRLMGWLGSGEYV